MHNQVLDTLRLTCQHMQPGSMVLCIPTEGRQMVSLLLGFLGSIVGAWDLSKIERDGAAVAWFVGGSVVTLFVPFGGLAMLAAMFPLRKWVSARKLEQTAAALAAEPAPPSLPGER